METRLLTFTFDEPDGLPRVAEPVRCSFSVGMGELGTTENLRVVDLRSGATVAEAVVETLSTWPDGSVGWIGVELPVTVEAHGRCERALIAGAAAALLAADGSHSNIDARATAPYRFDPLVDGAALCVFANAVDEVLRLRPYVVDHDGSRHLLNVVEAVGPSLPKRFHRRVELTAETTTLRGLRLDIALDIHPDAGLVDVELCIHNPAAARHAGGLWDIGDPASILFREIGVEMIHADGKRVSVELTGDGDRPAVGALSVLHVEQFSSPADRDETVGGKTSSDFHVLADGVRVAEGSRVNPLGTVALPNGTLSVHVSRFWQEQPSALRLTPPTTLVALFAAPASGPHELQPGERKRRNLSLHLADGNREPARWLASRLPVPEASSSIGPSREHCLRALPLRGHFDEALASLVVSPGEFFTKREVVDEYGWRDFGEVFADHESLYREPGETPFVSHYNNQYDLVLGFALQFLRTNDARWRELMNDLARHVTDIDIYHTLEDRIEYNHGLFWHTNHYQDAGTATHRTFSNANYDPDDPSGSSGGPGPEHCYTSGLALHYLTTGDAESKEAVLGLAAWMRDYFDGDGSLMGRLHSIAKRELPAVVGLLRRRDRASHAYPLTRATGNLIVAFLDAYLLSGEREWIDAAGRVLEDTFHPDDDVAARGLDDVEATWSHTVLLQAVLRYLSVKEALGEEDASHEFARRAFLAYSRWTLEHAVPYLDSPGKLEFVNDTWAAQDIRRHVLMVAAAAYDESNADAYLAKAELFGEHVLEVLGNSETRHFTRIQAIILQNLGMASLFVGRRATGSRSADRTALFAKRRSTVPGELRGAVAKLARGLRGFDARAEIRWLRTRR